MNAESEKPRDDLAEQLAVFDNSLQSMADDVDMITEIQEGIGSLLASSGNSEAEIRRVLQEQYEAGELRKETFQLVKSMLDRYMTEQIPTSPVARAVKPRQEASSAPQEPEEEDSFGATTVLPSDALSVNDADARVQAGSILRDRFLLQEKISGGSMGVVYKAFDRRLAEAGTGQASVAIKVLSPALAEDGNALRALQQEATKTRCLIHPNIVRFIDLDRDDDLYFLVLEWLEGQTLAAILDSSDAKAIDKDAAFRIVRQIGDALDYAHRCGIVHADVKPGNIMILPDGNAKLFDFGVARVRQKQAENDFDPGVLGALTPAYSSLQVLGGEEPTPADDVFSLACLFYRLVAGYRVFGPRNAAEASEAGMQPQRPQGLTDGQWATLKKALSYARVTRFGSVREFVDELSEQGEESIAIDMPERFVSEEDGGSLGKWVAVVFVLLGLAGVVAHQLGYLDPWIEEYVAADSTVEIAPPEEIVTEVIDDPIVPADQVTDAPSDATPVEPEEAPDPPAEPTEGPVSRESAAESTAASASPVEPAPAEDNPVEEAATQAPSRDPAPQPGIDFSRLPPADAIIRVSASGEPAPPVRIVLREDGEPATIDFVRDGRPDGNLALRLEEIAYDAPASPWSTGQYALSNAGLVMFRDGQQRARITLRAASDPRREPDETSTLRLRRNDSAESELGIVHVTIEDDDRRNFEDRLPANTVGFSTTQVSVNEGDSAVQVDVRRFNPDASPLVVGFKVEDVTATQGEDYFAPDSSSVNFGPGEKKATLLIPLVQDSLAEGDEAFVVKLNVYTATQPIDVSPNIAVMIRDDEL
jgi:serine/threonine protein kinase